MSVFTGSVQFINAMFFFIHCSVSPFLLLYTALRKGGDMLTKIVIKIFKVTNMFSEYYVMQSDFCIACF